VNARLYVRRPSGAVAVFLASHCEIDCGLVTATGRWKGYLERPAREYIWPASRVLEIRREVIA
jgi:hypothetical protein